MGTVQSGAVPEASLLSRYTRAGAYTDCYTTDVPGLVSHASYVEAFYTTWTFKLERLILARLVDKPSTDTEARELSAGTRDEFAAWTVEARAGDELLLCDFQHRTRSWLMVEAVGSGDPPVTRLYFGSAVVPVLDESTGKLVLGTTFSALLGFHKLYSRVLLSSASARLAKLREAD